MSDRPTLTGRVKATRYAAALGMRIRLARLAAGRSLADCGLMLNVSRQLICDLEQARTTCSAFQLAQLAEFLTVDPAWLLTGEREGESPKLIDLLT